MFDFLRNLTKSAEEKRQEQLHAYLDNVLTPQERQQFEQELARDPVLRVQLDNTRILKQQLQNLPPRRVPRNFTLDPAVYGRPARQPLFQYYPVLQGATVLTALFFILAISLTLFRPQAAPQVASAPQEAAGVVAQATEAPALEAFEYESGGEIAADEALDESRSATEVSIEALEVEVAEEEAADEEEMAEEEMAEDSAESDVTETSEGETSDTAADADGATASEPPSGTIMPPVAATGLLTPTLSLPMPTPMATPTESVIPRPVTPTTEARVLELQATEIVETESAANAVANDAIEQQPAPTATPRVTVAEFAASPLVLAQIVLGLLLLLFGGLTFYVRRNS